MAKQFRGTIEKWYVIDGFRDDAYIIAGWITPEKDEERHYQGFMPGRSTTISTSAVVKQTEDEVETLNSIYKLGKKRDD